MPESSTKRIIRIDASALKNGSCPLAFYRNVIEGYKWPVNNNDIEFGTAVHLFLKTMCETNGQMDKALLEAREYFENTKMLIKYTKKYLDVLYLFKVCTQYWEWLREHDNFNIILGADGKPAVEVTFSNKIWEDDNYIVLLEGTIDKIGQFKDGCFAEGDYKTTSSRDVEDYFCGYELSTQLMFYVLNTYLYAEQNPDSLIAEICKYGQLGAFIDGIFLNGKDSFSFERSRIFFFTKEQLARYKGLLIEKILHLLIDIKYNNPHPTGMLTDTCSKPENSSGGAWRCRYFNACAAPDKIAETHILKNEFVKEEYKPLLFGKKKK